jgi:hypothetical protein
MKLIPARCPSCGASIEVNRDNETTKCKYCDTKIIIDEAIAKYKIEIENMPTAQSYLKLGARNLENGDLAKAHELLEKALEINPDNSETIIKERLSVILQKELTEKSFNVILTSYKDASKFCSEEKLDDLIMYSIKLLDKKRMETSNFISNKLTKPVFLKNVYQFILFLNFYERVFRNHIQEVDNKISIIKKIFACIQCYRNAFINKNDNVNYSIPEDMKQFLLTKEKQYEKELAELDEEYRNRKEKIAEEEKLAREERERREKEAREAAARAAAERARLEQERKARKKAAAIMFGTTAVDIVCSIVDAVICGFFLLMELALIVMHLVEFSLPSIIFVIIAMFMSIPAFILKLVLRKKVLPKVLINIFSFVRYLPIFIMIIISFLLNPYFLDTQPTFVGHTYVSEEALEQIIITEENFTLTSEGETKTYDYTYVYENEIHTITIENVAVYNYYQTEEKLCLLDEKANCTKYYNIKKDAE